MKNSKKAKFSLNKSTISNLNSNILLNIRGGFRKTAIIICSIDGLPPTMQTCDVYMCTIEDPGQTNKCNLKYTG